MKKKMSLERAEVCGMGDM